MFVWGVRYITSWQNLVLGSSQSTFMSDVTKENFLFQERLICFVLLCSILLSIFMSDLVKKKKKRMEKKDEADEPLLKKKVLLCNV